MPTTRTLVHGFIKPNSSIAAGLYKNLSKIIPFVQPLIVILTLFIRLELSVNVAFSVRHDYVCLVAFC